MFSDGYNLVGFIVDAIRVAKFVCRLYTGSRTGLFLLQPSDRVVILERRTNIPATSLAKRKNKRICEQK
jgi:hypothetical protein